MGVRNRVDQDEEDQKVIAVPSHDTVDQVFSHIRRELEHFFSIYKELEGKKTHAQGWHGPQQAREAIVTSPKRFLDRRRPQAQAGKP